MTEATTPPPESLPPSPPGRDPAPSPVPAAFEAHSAVQLLVDPLSGAIVDANPAAARFYGWPRARLRQMRIQDIDALSPVETQREIDQANARQSPCFEFRHRLADDSIREVAVFSGTTAPEGRGLLHFIVHDITDHRQREIRLRQAQKMEAVGRLVEGVAHDFKNMLQIILGSAELAQMKLDPDSPAQPELDEIQNAARRSTEMARHLLAFSRKQTVEPRALDLNETVEGILKILRRLLGENIELSWRPGPNAGTIQIDPTQLDQILATLCVNARDAIDGAGVLAIETGTTRLDASLPPGTEGGDYARLTVRDLGPGSSPGTTPPPAAPSAAAPRPGEESGLGLANIRDIAAQNRGFIEVDGPPNQATAVHLFLPRFTAASPSAPPQAPAARGNETILLVEDEPAVLKQTERTLLHLGYRVLTALSPDEALHVARHHPGDIHLLLADIVMPRMDGRDLARALRALRPRTRALFMSAYPASAIARHGAIDGSLHLLSKPFASDVLDAAIRQRLAPEAPGQ